MSREMPLLREPMPFVASRSNLEKTQRGASLLTPASARFCTRAVVVTLVERLNLLNRNRRYSLCVVLPDATLPSSCLGTAHSIPCHCYLRVTTRAGTLAASWPEPSGNPTGRPGGSALRRDSRRRQARRGGVERRNTRHAIHPVRSQGGSTGDAAYRGAFPL